MANEMFSSLPDVMTAEQLASALQISKSGAYALLSRPDFPTLRIGGRKMVMKRDLLSSTSIDPYHPFSVQSIIGVNQQSLDCRLTPMDSPTA